MRRCARVRESNSLRRKRMCRREVERFPGLTSPSLYSSDTELFERSRLGFYLDAVGMLRSIANIPIHNPPPVGADVNARIAAQATEAGAVLVLIVVDAHPRFPDVIRPINGRYSVERPGGEQRG